MENKTAKVEGILIQEDFNAEGDPRGKDCFTQMWTCLEFFI